MSGNTGNGNVSVGSEPGSDKPGDNASNEPHHPDPSSKTLGEGQDGKNGKNQTAPDASDYGKEGTNKTLPYPKPDNASSEELGGDQPHIPKSPYTRG